MSDGFFFLTFFFFIFAAWVAGGGPSKPISYAGPYLSPLTTGITITTIGRGPGDNGQGNLTEAEQQLANLQKQANQQVLFGTPSPLKGTVVLVNGNAQATDPAQQYIDVRNEGDAPVTISGWKVTSVATDRTVTIPYGDPLPGNGFASAKSPIVLQPGDDAYLITGSSPFGASFRENECLGYLDPHQTLVPSLSYRCPSPRDEFARFYTGNAYKDTQCYTEIQNVSSCRVPATGIGLSTSCYSFIDQHLNYSGCVSAHQNDSQFRGTTWRVYLDYHDPNAKNKSVNALLWRSDRDAIKLLDQSGLTVDLLQY